MKQYVCIILCSLLVLLLLGGCSEKASLEELAQADTSLVSSGNLLGLMPKAETEHFLFFSHICDGARWIFRLDLETGAIQLNCMDPMCSHRLDDAATCPGSSESLNLFYPAGERVYSIPYSSEIRSAIVAVGENTKELLPISQTMGAYRLPRIYKGNIIAYDSKVDEGKVLDRPSRFLIYSLTEQKVTGQIDAMGTDIMAIFIEDDVIYYTTTSYDCYRQPLSGGEPQKIAEKTDNIFYYNGKVYYRSIPDSGPLQLWRMNPDRSDPEMVLKDAYVINILNDSIVYSKNDRTAGVYFSDLNGEMEQVIIEPSDYAVAEIYAAQRYGKFLVTLENAKTVYFVDPQSGEVEEKQLPVPSTDN